MALIPAETSNKRQKYLWRWVREFCFVEDMVETAKTMGVKGMEDVEYVRKAAHWRLDSANIEE